MRKTTKEGMKAPVITVAVLLVILGLVVAAMIRLLSLGEAAATLIAVIYIIAALAVMVGLVLSLIKRKKELDSGEEEEARKY